MRSDAWYDRFQGELEDFWSRRDSSPICSRTFRIFGHQVTLTANQESLLKAADYAIPLYSSGPALESNPFTIHLVAGSPGDGSVTIPVPANLFDLARYTGTGTWLDIQLGPFAHAHVDLSSKQAWAVLDPLLAAHPALVSRYLLNTVLTNFLIASGYGFLHATALVRDREVLLLMAGHNSGKSTTALRLALAGYRLLSDSMVFINREDQPGRPPRPRLFGFPVGRIKLRADVAATLPQFQSFLEDEPIRGEIKRAIDLRQVDPRLVCETAVDPESVHLCLLELGHRPETKLTTITEEEIWPEVMANSLFFDSREVWQTNLSQIGRLVEAAGLYRLQVGRDPDHVLAVVAGLFGVT